MDWTEQQVWDLVYNLDQRQVKILAQATRWTLLGQSESLLWGQCRANGEVFRTGIDLAGPYYASSCSNYGEPCVQGARLLLLVRTPGDILKTLSPVWMAWWLAELGNEERRVGGRDIELPYRIAQQVLEAPDNPVLLARRGPSGLAAAGHRRGRAARLLRRVGRPHPSTVGLLGPLPFWQFFF